MATYTNLVRRGLPREPGGEPWPPAGGPSPAGQVAVDDAVAPDTAVSGIGGREVAVPAVETPSLPDDVVAVPIRRGLPRAPGGDAWPPAGTGHVRAKPAASGSSAAEPTAAARPTAREHVLPAAASRAAPRKEPRVSVLAVIQWGGVTLLLGFALVLLAGAAVMLTRWLLSLDALQDFLTAYPGSYPLPADAPVGIPAWLGWQHFFNVFLLVLIVRSGLQVRTQKRPSAFWTPRGKPKGKISLALWFHQSLDLLWLVNGVAFVVLLFATGQWMRVVPTSWAVFPNALSAGLQYVSLDWPTENGWVYYNALQQLTYFVTIFVAAPLSVITGYRMSKLWPHRAAWLSRVYRVEWARALHFPLMLYFVAFTAVHVFLVFATGALRNLNHMYAAQGSTDPTAFADNWTGFWIFVLSLIVIVAAVIAARPLVLAPIARLFGSVSGR